MVERPDFPLGSALVQPSTRMITGPGGSAQLEPRVMQVLIVLADSAGAVVTRDTLLARCWGGVFVGDDSLNRAVAGVRRVAAIIAGGSFEIETVPRTGYRLVASAPDDAAAEPEPGSEHSETSPDKVSRRWVLGGGLAAAVAGAAFWTTRPTAEDPADSLMAESRTVLRGGTPATDQQAIALLEKAVQVSPDNAAAWGLLALTLARVDEHAIGKTEHPASKVDRAANRALQLDGNNADAKAALALAIPYYGDWLGAERRFLSILEQHPDHVVTKDSYSFFLGTIGRMIESGRIRVGFSDDAPFDAGIQYRHIYGLWFLGRIAEADRVASRGMEMWPGHPGIWFGRLWLLASTSRFDRAIAHVDDAASRPPLPPPMVQTIRAAIAAAASNRPAEIENATRMVMAGAARSVAGVVNAMMLLNLMKSVDAAFDLANAYYLEQGPIIAAMQWRPGQPDVPDQRRRKTNMLFTPTAAAMRADPRFLPLMERMGIADYWRRRGVTPDFLKGQPA